MNLKRVEVIGDDEGEIVEAVRRMSDNYDFVVTRSVFQQLRVARFLLTDTVVALVQRKDKSCKLCAGDLAYSSNDRHDDITYQSIAKAFDLKLVEHEDALRRMKALSKPHPSQPDFSYDVPSPALEAKKRMIRLPIDRARDEKNQVLFVDESLWVPISVVNGNIHILPGVPRLFEKLLEGLKTLLIPRLTDPEGKGVYRILISTPMAESAVAGYLTELAAEVEPHGVKVGSYPRWGRKRNSVTLVGRDKVYMETLVSTVEKNVQGVRVENEEDADQSDDPEE